jgi:hypothetical protein
MNVHFSHEPDRFKWSLTTKGSFSVKYMYANIMNGHTIFLKKYLWKIKVRLKFRIFMWFIYKKVILNKYNLAKRRWTGCTKCVFCGYHEMIDHLFISCSFAHLVWRVVHFTYNIPPPTSVNNLFANWLNGIDKQTKARICVGVCALTGRYGIVVMMFCLTGMPNQFFSGYPQSCIFNSHVVLPRSAEAARTYGYRK